MRSSAITAPLNELHGSEGAARVEVDPVEGVVPREEHLVAVL